MRIGEIAILCIAVMSFCALPASGREPPQPFVRKFCDWYAPLALRGSDVPAWVVALSKKPALFGRELTSAIKADEAEQAKTPGEPNRLGFDPFFNSQDAGHEYVAGDVMRQKGTHWADIHGVSERENGLNPMRKSAWNRIATVGSLSTSDIPTDRIC